MSSDTHATTKQKKKTNHPPGTLKGPMRLPISYNREDYIIDDDGRVNKIRRDKGRGTNANRHRKNKLLDAEPIG